MPEIVEIQRLLEIAAESQTSDSLSYRWIRVSLDNVFIRSRRMEILSYPKRILGLLGRMGIIPFQKMGSGSIRHDVPTPGLSSTHMEDHHSIQDRYIAIV